MIMKAATVFINKKENVSNKYSAKDVGLCFTLNFLNTNMPFDVPNF